MKNLTSKKIVLKSSGILYSLNPIYSNIYISYIFVYIHYALKNFSIDFIMRART